MRKNYIHASVHQFKTHFSRYLRQMESGFIDGVVVERYKRRVGVFMLLKFGADEEVQFEEKQENEKM